MRVEDVDVLEAHALQALVEAGQQILARSPVAIRAGPHIVAGLGADDQFVAIGLEIEAQNLAEVAFRASRRRAVVVGQVEVGDAQVEGAAHHGAASSRSHRRRRSCAKGRERWRAGECRCARSGGTAWCCSAVRWRDTRWLLRAKRCGCGDESALSSLRPPRSKLPCGHPSEAARRCLRSARRRRSARRGFRRPCARRRSCKPHRERCALR